MYACVHLCSKQQHGEEVYVGFRLLFYVEHCIRTPMAAFKESVQLVPSLLSICQKKKKKIPFLFSFICFRKQINYLSCVECLIRSLSLGQIQRYDIHSVSIKISGASSPQQHSRSGLLEIWCIIVENSSLLFKAVA